MAISLTAEAIILAINSAIKLGDSLQRAYANSIKAKVILLPLPGFNNRPNSARAHRFFKENGKVFLAKVERIQKLFDDFEVTGLGGTDQDDYIDYYIQLEAQLDKARREGEVDDKEINLENMLALLRVRQWESGKMPCNSPVKMVAGTLVEIGIDYFNQVPGALNPESSLGRAMKYFLSALDDIKLSETSDFRALSELIVPRLFIAAAETLETLSKDISGDEKVQAFIAATSRGIAEEVMQRTRHAADDEAVKWGQLILRSMVKNAGQYVFHSPADLFHTNEGASRLIQSTGNVLLEAILTDPDKLDLKKGFNIDILDQVMRSGLKVIAEHPELVDGRDGFREVVMGVSATMAEAGIKNRPDLLPELVRLILEHTAGNLHLIVRSSPEEAGKHLLVVAVQQLLLALSQPAVDERWRLHLPKGQLLAIAENILDEVVANPNWVLAKIGEKTLLQETLDATFRALGGLPKTERLNRQVLEMLFQINIRTVVTNQAVLNRLKWGGDEQEATILQRGLDLIFTYVFESGKVAPAERVQLLSELMRYISRAILSHHPDAKGLLLIDMILFRDPNVNYAGGFNPKLADELIHSALNVLQTHPELVSGQVSLQNIISGVAGALRSSSFREAGILPELVRLSLLYTAENIHLIILSEEDEPKYLIVLALRELLAALSVKTEADHWQPRLTAAQLVAITENIFDKVVHHPQWLIPDAQGDTLFGAVLRASFQALQALPKDERLQPGTLETIVQLALSTVISRPEILEKVKWGKEEEEAVILQHALALTVSFVFERSKTAAGNRLQLLIELMHYVLEVIMQRHPNRKGLLLIDLILFEDPDVDFSQGFRPELADQLLQATLKVLDYRPDLVTSDLALQHIIEGVAGALKSAGYRRRGLLPELIRLILECTADNLQLIAKTDAGEPQFLLVEALRLLLAALTQDVEDGQWKPALSGAEVLGIAETVFDELLQHPQWVIPDEAGDTLFAEVAKACLQGLRAMPPEERLGSQTLSAMLRLALRTTASSPRLMDSLRWGTADEEAAILEHVFQLTVSFVFEKSGAAAGHRLVLLTDLLHYLLEMLMSRQPNKKGLLLLDLILFEDPEVDYSRGFQPELYDKLIEAAIKVLDYRPDLVTGDKAFQHIIEGVMGALKASGFRGPGLPLELMRLVLACTAENIQLVVRADDGSVQYLLVVALEPLLKQLSARPAADEKWQPQLNAPQMLAILEEVLDYLVIHSSLVTEKLRQGTVFSETIAAVFEALSRLPKTQRIQPENLAWLLHTSLQAASTSRAVLQKIHWGPDEEEAVILQKALEMVFTHVFPGQGPSRAESLEDLLEYVLEFILRHHQDKKVLLLLYLILFETPELGPLPAPASGKIEELIDVALQLLTDYPDLVTRDAVWQKIIQDTAKALQDSQLGMPELLPELLRLMLLNTAKNTDLLTGLNPNSRQYVLAMAMEQCLTAIAAKPKRGKWKPQLSRQQILEIVEMCLDTMIRNPLWVQDKLLEAVLLSIFEALQTVPEERKLAYATVRLLIENSLKAVSFRKNLAIEVVNRQGRRQVIGLTYALEGLFVTLYTENEATETASWTLTQTQVLDAVLDSFLKGLIEGPITKEAIDEALEPLRTAVEDLAENAAFSLDELLEELEQ